MVPNWEYAKSMKTIIDFNDMNEPRLMKKIGAAYRVTIFRCIQHNCTEHENDYYINHCIGCGEPIDQRDSSDTCSNKWIICKSCYACCDDDNHIFGSCPDDTCDGKLTLYEKNSQKFAYCTKRCGFRISTYKLPERMKILEAHHIFN